MTTNKRTLLRAGLTATAALAAKATGLAAAARAGEAPSIAGDAVTAAALAWIWQITKADGCHP